MSTVKLRACDSDELFAVKEDAAKLSGTIATMLSCVEAPEDMIIPLMRVSVTTMPMLIEWMNFYSSNADTPTEQMQLWEKEYFKRHKSFIVDLINAADYMDLKSLYQGCCMFLANKIARQTPEQIRELFGTQNDFQPEELNQMKQEEKLFKNPK